MNDGKFRRLFGYSLKGQKRFVQEFVSETSTLLFVPSCSCREIPIRLFPESD